MKLDRVFLVGLLAFLSCKFEASCGVSELNMEKVRSFAKKLLEDQEVPVESVSCPDAVEAEKGATFSCKAHVEGEGAVELTLRVTQEDDEGNVKLTLVEPVTVSSKLEDEIKKGFEEQTGVEPTVDCGQPVRITEKGKRFRCAAQASGQALEIEVLMKGEGRGVDWEVVD